MRLINLITGDIKFQFKYGFYFIYVAISVIYVCILSMLEEAIRAKAGSILVFSDPAAMGMFFMGAIVLLEKSQRVLESIAVSPVSASEYIVSKIISIGFISTIVGGVLSYASAMKNLPVVLLGVFLASAIFTMCGLIVGAKVKSLNQYLIATIPFEIIGFLPPIAFLFGFQKDNVWMLLHPGCALILLIQGETQYLLLILLVVVLWIFILFMITRKVIIRMFASVGGVKL